MTKSSADQQVLPDEAQFASWCARLIKSDRGAFEKLFGVMSKPLYLYVLRLTRAQPLAEDIVQEVFLRIWQKRTALDPSRSLRALMYVSARNLALGHERTQANRQSLLSSMDQPMITPSPEEAAWAKMLGAHIKEWINELPERRREAFQLSRFDGLGYEEIAHIMGLSVKTVDNHIWKALQHLKGRLAAYDTELLRS